MDIIVSHVNLDFDSLAGMVAAQKLFTGAKLVFTGSQNRNVREFIQLHRDILDFVDVRQVEAKKVKCIIVVDTRMADRLGELERMVKRKGVEIVIFDHHPTTPEDMQATKEFSAEVGAVTTILVEMLREQNVPISPFEATLFALGIHEDTGSLTYASTSHRDAEALTFLIQKNANIEVVHRFLDFSLDEEQRRLLKALLDSARIVDVRGRKVLFTRARVLEYVDSAAALTHKVGDLENVDIVFTLLKLRDRVNVIARSRGEVDMGKVLEKFGGGGHPQAASASVKGATLKELEEELIEEVSQQIKAPVKAAGIMAKPLMIDIATPVKKARDEMQRYGVTGLPVIEKGKLVGTISKRDVEKAVSHGLTHAPVKGFMSHKVVTISPETPLHRILELLSESEVDRLPVVEDKKIVGVVSRREALRAVHGLGYLSPFRSSAEPSKIIPREEIASRLNSLLPRKVRWLLDEIGTLAEENGLNVYLVGGFVRDLIMNHRNLDIDLVVEGNGIFFARRLVKKLAGRLTYHEKFGTAVVTLPDDFRIDVASARTEFYGYPAALPQVEFGTVRQDLFRRDFTINAMAISLNTSHFGELLDYFGGLDDIEQGRIRVLHELSFIDDPTRIFRAVRFEQRYGFKMSDDTEKLARKAVDLKLIKELTGVRVRDELILILSEPQPWQVLKRLQELGVLEVLHPKLKIDADSEALFREIGNILPRVRRQIKVSVKPWLVYLIALVKDLTAEEIPRLASSMRIRAEDRRVLLKAVKDTPRILQALSKDMKKSQLYHLLHGLPSEVLSYVYAAADWEGRERIVHYFSLQNIRLEITGDDLIKLGYKPSAMFKQVLDYVFTAKLDGQVTIKEEELSLADEVFRKLEGKKGK